MTIPRSAWMVIGVVSAVLLVFATVWWLRARSVSSLALLSAPVTESVTSSPPTPSLAATGTPSPTSTPVVEPPIFFSPQPLSSLPGLRILNVPISPPRSSVSPPPEVVSSTDAQVGALDTDHDGLTDDQERQLGTDPTKPDTDGDTLSDGDEVKKYRTDPLKADSDGDGYTDAQEIKNGYNPVGTGKCLTTGCIF